MSARRRRSPDASVAARTAVPVPPATAASKPDVGAALRGLAVALGPDTLRSFDDQWASAENADPLHGDGS